MTVFRTLIKHFGGSTDPGGDFVMTLEPYRARWMTDDVVAFQDIARRFFEREFVPHLEGWRAQGCIDRNLWYKAGELGLLGASMPEEFGGGGSKAFMAAILLEQGRAGDAAWGISVQNYVSHYILAYGTEEQKARWLPGLGSGQTVAAIAMTEPGAGSDLKQLKTVANAVQGGYVLNGQKTFISNGQSADLVCVAAKTDLAGGSRGISLLMVEVKGADGFLRGKPLKKIGLQAADTSELFFEDVFVPQENLLGQEEGQGFRQLMTQLPWERLSIAIRCVGLAEYALDQTIAHVTARKAFGGTLFDLQNTQFKLAEAKTKLESMRSFVDSCLDRLVLDQLDIATAAMCKLHCSQAINEIVDECLQLHGGYGFMEEYGIARLYGDVRAQKIYGGTSEVMKLLVARSLIA
ncbi:acyl-CoA dehydrogenase family protein [Sphingomonas paeninsulae]